jgi:hypothetical protein
METSPSPPNSADFQPSRDLPPNSDFQFSLSALVAGGAFPGGCNFGVG